MTPKPTPEATPARDTEGEADSFQLFRRARAGDRDALRSLLDRHEERLWRIVRIRMKAGRSLPIEAREIIRAARTIDLRELERGALADGASATGEREAEPAGLPELLQILSDRIQRRLEERGAPSLGAPARPAARPVPRQYPFGRRPALPAAPGDQGLPIEREWAAKLRALLDDNVRELPPELREVVLMRDYCCASWPEIGHKLGIDAPEALLARHGRAWQQLRAQMRGQVGELL